MRRRGGSWLTKGTLDITLSRLLSEGTLPGAPPTENSRILVRTTLTVTLTVLAVAVAVFLVVLARLSIVLILAGVLVAVFLNHGAEALERKNVRRPLAIAAVLLAVLAVLTGGALLIFPSAIRQGRDLYDNLPRLAGELRQTPLYQAIDRRIQIDYQVSQVMKDSGSIATHALNPALKAIGSVLSVGFALVTLLFLSIFMLIFGGRLVRGLMEESTSDNRERYERIAAKIYRSIGGYLSGLGIICLANATATTTFLAISRMPFFLPLGILSGLSSLIPYIGPTATGVLITLLSMMTGGIWHGLATAIYFTVYGQIEGNVLSPFVFRKVIHVNPLITLTSVLLAADVAGVPGAILAVPAAASAQIIVREILRARRERLNVPPEGDVARAQQVSGEVEASKTSSHVNVQLNIAKTSAK